MKRYSLSDLKGWNCWPTYTNNISMEQLIANEFLSIYEVFSCFSSHISAESDSVKVHCLHDLFRFLINATTHAVWLLVGTETESLLLTACDFKQHFVVEAQSELRHPRQDNFELNAAHYFTAQDAAIGTHLQDREQSITLSMNLYLIIYHGCPKIFFNGYNISFTVRSAYLSSPEST